MSRSGFKYGVFIKGHGISYSLMNELIRKTFDRFYLNLLNVTGEKVLMVE